MVVGGTRLLPQPVHFAVTAFAIATEPVVGAQAAAAMAGARMAAAAARRASRRAGALGERRTRTGPITEWEPAVAEPRPVDGGWPLGPRPSPEWRTKWTGRSQRVVAGRGAGGPS